jgi:hypothetical protein
MDRFVPLRENLGMANGSRAKVEDFVQDERRPFPRKRFTIASNMTDPSKVTNTVGSVMASFIVPTLKIGLNKKPAKKAPTTATRIFINRLERSRMISVATQPITAATTR